MRTATIPRHVFVEGESIEGLDYRVLVGERDFPVSAGRERRFMVGLGGGVEDGGIVGFEYWRRFLE